jgi:hypothetical protein
LCMSMATIVFVRRWDAASSELRSQMIRSKRHEYAAPSTETRELPKKKESADKLLQPHSSRKYGFASSNIRRFDDHHSENLYRLKNVSSEHMRETSPTMDDAPPARPSDETHDKQAKEGAKQRKSPSASKR